MKRFTILSAIVLLVVAAAVAAQIAKTPAPAGAKAYIISPKNGDTVASTFTVQFGLKGLGVAPAGVMAPNTGHHHLLIDMADMPNMAVPLPVTDKLKHFGGGQTETELTLPAGQHTLQLVVGDYLHLPHEAPIVSEKITITVR